MSSYQIHSPTSRLSKMMGNSPGSLPSPQELAEEASRKRELRLLKNRESARQCRRRRKEHVQSLETLLATMENQNKKLTEASKGILFIWHTRLQFSHLPLIDSCSYFNG
ncbi:cAMP-responsive element modulator-like isoform X3 [Myxocyprinus asiaticus]|nr:cAMP-responsive element modulator-like isoform X3 [Myxocyprinus asiaticus]XP_051538381.1 cAMP-responsive element modulator-like isoform X3 [Myxocyprinus asiaticus]XP_051538382.1 cAMP-responsive element modulator-like isoform X3 [Myxocyprinus asiaticus]